MKLQRQARPIPQRHSYQCPHCGRAGVPIEVSAENGVITTSIRCTACGQEWAINKKPLRRNPLDDLFGT